MNSCLPPNLSGRLSPAGKSFLTRKMFLTRKPVLTGKPLLIAVCAFVAVSTAQAQNFTAGYSRPSQPSQKAITLRPVDTGRSVVTFAIGGSPRVHDRFAIKTNLLHLAGAMTPNLGFDFGLGGKTSIGLAGGYNKWGNLWDFSVTGPEYDPGNLYKRRLDHIFGKVEFKYWFNRRFKGHFLGVQGFYADYLVGELGLPPLFEKRLEHDGNLYGGALSYGWFWRWTPHWGMEFTLGAGVAIVEYESRNIEIVEGGFKLTNPNRYRKTYIGPTNAGINLVFTM